jgi:hypothetical protein
MYKEDRFEMGDQVVCIKQYETLKPKSHYKIKGCGDLTWNAATDKEGYGFCIEDEFFGSDKKDWWKKPYSERVKWYYFTLEEMNELFITQAEDYVTYTRDIKINSILDGNR